MRSGYVNQVEAPILAREGQFPYLVPAIDTAKISALRRQPPTIGSARYARDLPGRPTSYPASCLAPSGILTSFGKGQDSLLVVIGCTALEPHKARANPSWLTSANVLAINKTCVPGGDMNTHYAKTCWSVRRSR